MPAVSGGYEAAEPRREAAPRFLVEELRPFSRPEHVSANKPLELDDPAAVWLVTSGGVDVFFTVMEPGAAAGRRCHLCRVDEGGSIFAVSGVRGRTGGGLVAVGAGPAELLKFSRGDLIRLSFEEGLTEQVALLVDDWLHRVGLALSHSAGTQPSAELRRDAVAAFDSGTRFGVRGGAAWVRHLGGTSRFLDRVALPDGELENRFPLTENLWLTASGPCRVTACDTQAVIHSGDPWAGLDAFHRVMLDYVTEVQEREATSRWSEVVRSTTHQAEVIEWVSARLAAAAGATEGVATGVDGGGLFGACRVVGEALGIDVLAPRLSADVDDSAVPASTSWGVWLARPASRRVQ